jgi:hypothetical protein
MGSHFCRFLFEMNLTDLKKKRRKSFARKERKKKENQKINGGGALTLGVPFLSGERIYTWFSRC